MAINNRTKRGSRATRSIWALTALGLLTGVLLLGVEENLGRKIAENHRSISAFHKESNNSVLIVDGAVHRMNGSLGRILDGLELPVPPPAAPLQSGILLPELQLAVDTLAPLRVSKQSTLEDLAELASRVTHWEEQYNRSLHTFRDAQTLVERNLKQLDSKTQTLLGKQRLQRAVRLSRFQDLEGDAAIRAALSFTTDALKAGSCSGIQIEIAEFTVLLKRLIHAEDVELLHDLKENYFTPNLNRIRQLMECANSYSHGSPPLPLALLDSLEYALVGTQQPPSSSQADLFEHTRRFLSLERERQSLQLNLAELHDQYALERAYISNAIEHKFVNAISDVSKAITTTRLRTTPPVILAVIIFLLLARNVARALHGQMIDLSASNEASSKAHKDLELTQEAIPSILIELDLEGTICAWNRLAQNVLDTPPELAVGFSLDELQVDWDRDLLRNALETCKTKTEGTTIRSLPFTAGSGHRGTLELQINPKRGPEGDLQGMLIVGSDIQERLNIEAQLSQSQKLESIGQLAAGIAHEINTPTQYATDNARFLGEASGNLLEIAQILASLLQDGESLVCTAEQTQELVEKIKNADLDFLLEELPKSKDECLVGLGHVARIVLAMKEFSHPGEVDKTLVDLNHSIKTSIAVARNEWKYAARLELLLSPSLPQVLCVQGEINQVIVNLVVNAAHAIEDTQDTTQRRMGKISIETKTSGDWVEMRISDDGSGMPKAVQDRIFDPFYTTKEVGKGTGQGLSIARIVIVDQHQGTLQVESQPGEGTTFLIRLPLQAVAV
ncbi:MAG: signal transduction histidine kinase [Planctomycetota bacterium]|jgi:signal transduction histidine kinase